MKPAIQRGPVHFKFSIGNRLFLAVLLSFLAVAVVGVELVRWKLIDNFSEHAPNKELDRLGDLTDALSSQYRQHRDWSFLPAAPDKRKTWLQGELARLKGDQVAKSGTAPTSTTLGYRIGLLDREGLYLAGVQANPLLVAIASIDTIRRPLLVDGVTVGYIVVAKSQNPDDELAVAFLVQQQGNLFIVVGIGVLLSVLAAAWLAAHFRKPIAQLVAGARRLEDGQFDARLSIQRRDELGELAETFNHLAARLEDTERLRRQWVADTSHELRTPLSVLRGQMEALQDGVRAATPENIALMLRQTLALTKLVDELYEFARADIGQLQCNKSPNDAWRIVKEVLDEFSEKFREAGLDVTIAPAPARSTVNCDGDRMRQVVTNLLQNCVRYTVAGGRVEVIGTVMDDELRIAIADSTPGVPAESLARLGERFFRVDSSRSRQLGGAGLGLALSKQIVEAHDGRLEFAPSRLGGLCVTIILKLED